MNRLKGLSIGFGIFAVIGLLMLLVAFNTYYTVDEGDRGVVLRNGKIVSVSEPGLHFKLPFVEDVKGVSIRSHAQGFKGQGYTKDQQTTSFIVSVNYSVPTSKIADLYSKYQTIDSLKTRLLERVVPTQVKNVLGQYNAHNAISERPKMIAQIEENVKQAVLDEPIHIESLQVEDIEFSKAYEKSIEERMQAEVNIATKKQNLETEKVNAEIEATKAKGLADAKLTQAEAEAKAILVKGEAEAKAIKLKSDALEKNPTLVALTAAERWDGQLPKAMLPNSSLPLIDLSEKQIEKINN